MCILLTGPVRCYLPATGSKCGEGSGVPNGMALSWLPEMWVTRMSKPSVVSAEATLAKRGTCQDGDGRFPKVGKTGAASSIF